MAKKRTRNSTFNRKLSHFLPLSFLCLLLSSTADGAEPTAPDTPRIAIIIDDMGQQKAVGDAMIELPHALTFSFLPYRLHTITLANKAHALGREVMLHAPMESLHQTELGEGALTSDMGRLQLVLTLQRQLKSVPHVVGVNNHMGSALTQNTTTMTWFMSELSEYNLFFIDSKTIAQTVAADLARQHQIPTRQRDVFLDHVISEVAIEQEFNRLITLAQKRGQALAIGHPHRHTYRVLARLLPQLAEAGVQLVPASELLSVAPVDAPSEPMETLPEMHELILTESRLLEP